MLYLLELQVVIMQSIQTINYRFNVTSILLIIAVSLIVFHMVSFWRVARRLSRQQKTLPLQISNDNAKIDIICPVSGNDPFLPECLESLLQVKDWNVQFFFCLAHEYEAALPILHNLKEKYPMLAIQILIGDEKSTNNPKLNNIEKALNISDGEYLMIVDSNVLLSPNYLDRIMPEWSDDVGLVTSPPLGVHGENFMGNLEMAFLNSYQDRLQLFADEMGHGFAQGKLLFFRRSVWEKGGGFQAMTKDIAEDVASTKLIKSTGYKIKLTQHPVEQPIGKRRFQSLWARQRRWSKTRRFGFFWLYSLEPLSFPPLIWLLFWAGTQSLQTVLWLMLIGYLAEYLFVYKANWPRAPRQVLAWFIRDMLLFPLWIAGWIGRDFDWQGHKISSHPSKLEKTPL